MTAPVHGSVGWFQVGTDDPDGAKRFYGDLLGWTFEADPNGGGRYHLVTTPGGQRASGGIADTGGEAPNHAIFLAIVSNVADTVAQAERLGGKVLTPPTSTPAGLVFADLLDPSGNHFGVFTPPAG